MIEFDALRSFLELCASETTPDSVAAAFRKTIDALGFRYYACCSHVDPRNPPARAILVHNYPAAWVSHFCDAKLHRIDPVLQLAQREPLPFFWDTALRARDLTGAQNELLAEATAFGLAHGYTVPIHLSWLAGSVPASCSVIPDKPTLDPHRYLAVQTLATCLYAALNCAQAPSAQAACPGLTPRQRECLALAAQGKDDWTIGRLLCLSQDTVHTHIRLAMLRLGVTTRVQAIVRALQDRDILFSTVLPDRTRATRVPASAATFHLIR